MSKYGVLITGPEGDEFDLDEYFDTEEEAEEAGLDAVSECEVGARDEHMMNPGDYDYDEDYYNSFEYEVYIVKD